MNPPTNTRRTDHYPERVSAPIQDVLETWRAAGVTRFVYFVQEVDGGPVKIGTAADPLKRCTMLQCGNPRQLVVRYVIPGDTAVENSLHRRFWESRTAGEWFDIPEVVLAWAAGMEAAALEHLAHRGHPPVMYLRDQRPLDHDQRAEMWEKVRIAKRLRLDRTGFLTDYSNADPDLWHGVNVEREYQLMRRAGFAA